MTAKAVGVHRGWTQSLSALLPADLSLEVLAQSGLYVGANLAVTLLGIGASALLARSFTTQDFGAYSLTTSLLLFLATFFEFGLFLPVARLLATVSEDERPVLIGAALLAFIPIGASFSLTVVLVAHAADSVFKVHAGSLLTTAAGLAFVYPFVQVAQALAQGSSRLHGYSVAALAAQGLFVASLGLTLLLHVRLVPGLALSLLLIALTLAWLGFCVWLRPRFGGATQKLRALLEGARAYGFQVYIGRVLSMGTYNLDILMLGALATPASVGFYVLAGSISAASGLPVLALGTALFPSMTRARELDRRWLAIGWAVGLGAAAVAALLARTFLDLVMSARYDAAAAFVPPLALAAAVRGVTTLYNSFLSAHGMGRELRDAAIVLTLANVLFNFALIPAYGAAGAAWASLLALVLNLGAHVWGYGRYTASLAVGGAV